MGPSKSPNYICDFMKEFRDALHAGVAPEEEKINTLGTLPNPMLPSYAWPIFQNQKKRLRTPPFKDCSMFHTAQKPLPRYGYHLAGSRSNQQSCNSMLRVLLIILLTALLLLKYRRAWAANSGITHRLLHDTLAEPGSNIDEHMFVWSGGTLASANRLAKCQLVTQTQIWPFCDQLNKCFANIWRHLQNGVRKHKPASSELVQNAPKRVHLKTNYKVNWRQRGHLRAQIISAISWKNFGMLCMRVLHLKKKKSTL